tara:strand:- start:1913 stop:2323 length:411 start_codon:yes stop_codon:yes gene_type:complete
MGRQQTEYNYRTWNRKKHTKCLTKDIVQGKPCKTFSRKHCILDYTFYEYGRLKEEYKNINDDYSSYEQQWGSGYRSDAIRDFKKGYEWAIDQGYCGLIKVIIKENDDGLDRPEWYIWNLVANDIYLPTKFPTNKEL